ncbi:hypothetical protein P7C71_g3595, partial [Lecanoromycetidae sp. Uapishka_2]
MHVSKSKLIPYNCAFAAPTPSDYRLITQGTGGTFSYNGGNDPNAIGTDSCGTCVGFFVNAPGEDPVAYVAHVDSGATTLVPDDSSNGEYQQVVGLAQRLFERSPVFGWDASSAVFSTEGGDIGFAHAVRDGIMLAIGGSPDGAQFYSNSDGFVVPVKSDGSYQPILPPTQLNTQRNRNKWNGVELAGSFTWTIDS